MKKLVFIFISILGLSAQHKLDIAYLTSGTYVYTTYQEVYDGRAFPANGLYIVTNEGVILIDTPWDKAQTQPLLDSIEKRHNQKVKICIVTHFHDDRTAGLDILKANGVKTYSSQLTFEKGKERGEKTTEFQFTQDTTFTLGGIKCQTFYPGHGHSPDNIVIYFPKTKVLFGGCFVKSLDAKGLGNMEDVNVEEWKIAINKTIKKFKSARFVIPGHQSWANKNAMAHTLNLLINTYQD
jgi:metallo-beta-lactamase class B